MPVIVPYTQCILRILDGCPGWGGGGGGGGGGGDEGTEWDTLKTLHCRGYNHVV